MLIDLITTIATTGAEGVAGASGWVGAGLLGSVLAWLMFIHLPSKDKQLNEFISSKDKVMNEFIKARDTQFNELTNKYMEKVQETRNDFRASLEMILMHAEKQMSALLVDLDREFAHMQTVIASSVKEVKEHIKSQDIVDKAMDHQP